MPNANVVIPIMESTVNTLDSVPQGVALWLQYASDLVRKSDKGSDWWEFIELNGLVAADEELGITLGGETGAVAVGTDISDCLVYGLLVRNIGSQATEDLIVGITASKGSFSLDATSVDFDASTLNTGYVIAHCETSDGTIPEYATWLSPKGVRIGESTGEIYAFCDGNESTAPVAATVNIWVLLKVIAHD